VISSTWELLVIMEQTVCFKTVTRSLATLTHGFPNSETIRFWMDKLCGKISFSDQKCL
jgi:hypothetical protein